MKLGHRLGDSLKSLFVFSRGERRGILWLLPLLAVLSVLIVFANRPSFEESFVDLADVRDGQFESSGGAERVRTSKPLEYGALEKESGETPISGELFTFDPNTVTFSELCRMGFDKRTAAGIVKYRTKGKRFEIPEDFATCYGVSLADFERLEPYIEIGPAYRARPASREVDHRRRTLAEEMYGRQEDAGEGDSLFRFDPNRLSAEEFVRLGFSPRQAEVIVHYRESLGGFCTPEEFAECYVVSQEKYDTLYPYMEFPVVEQGPAGEPGPIELNGADSATLRTVRGIGEVLVTRIMERREQLGGFSRKEQLSEIPGMTEANYELICKQIYVDSCVIRKIDINFASPKELLRRLDGHPYLLAGTLRKILKYRQLKGGWSSLREMTDEHILTPEEAAKLAPYLSFRTMK